MVLDFNENKLNKILQTFNVLTNANICVFDCDFTPIANYGDFPCYCREIRKREDLQKKCLISDKFYSNDCAINKTSVTYTCHAGIVETISPIILEGVLIGYVIFGGLRDLEKVYSNENSVKKACDLYGLDYNEFLSHYNAIPSFNHTQLNAYVEIMKVCIKNILAENLLKPNTTLFSTKILNYLQENYAKQIKIKRLCKEFGVTEKTLYKIVKQTTNKTINDYLIYLRIEKSKQLLISTDYSISEIAYQVGYVDYNYFIRLFKKLTNLTPLKYRKQSK